MDNFKESNDSSKRRLKSSFVNVKPLLSSTNLYNRENSNVYIENEIFFGKENTTYDVSKKRGILLDTLQPTFLFLKVIGVFPISRNNIGKASFIPFSATFIYSVLFFATLNIFIVFTAMAGINIITSLEGRFEKTVIAYLFLVNILPIFIIPLTWIESKKLANLINDWDDFQNFYYKMEGQYLPLRMTNKALIVTIVLPICSMLSVIFTHITTIDFQFIQVVPYFILDNLTVMVGALWCLICRCLTTTALLSAEHFQKTLNNLGSASLIAHYRALWLRLSKLTRDTGTAVCYTFMFLCFYLFFIITLSLYGMMTQMTKGFEINNIGLIMTTLSSIFLLFFICDEAHHVSYNVQINFQMKILMTELNELNNEAQTEINMFLRATEMNPPNINCGGFFDINRNLFRSLLTTVVTYMVVLLQFQITIPTSKNNFDVNEEFSVLNKSANEYFSKNWQ